MHFSAVLSVTPPLVSPPLSPWGRAPPVAAAAPEARRYPSPASAVPPLADAAAGHRPSLSAKPWAALEAVVAPAD